MSYYRQPPAGWQRQRIKFLMDGSKNGAWGSDAGADECDAVCVRVADFDWGSLKLNTGHRTIRSFQQSQFSKLALQPGDLLLEKSGGGEKTPVGRIVAYKGEGGAVTSNFVARVRPTSNVEGRFLLYLLASQYMSGFSYQFIKQNTGIQNLDDNAWFATDAYLPDQKTQKFIVDFLNRETSRIDQLIEKKKALAALLREKETSDLREVFHGAPRIKMKFVAGIIAGQSPSGDDVKDHGKLPFLQGCAEFSEVSPLPKRFCDNPSKVAQPGDWLFSVRAPVGKINLADTEYGIGRGLAAIRSSQMSKSYLGLALRASAFHLAKESTGSTYEAVSSSDVGNLLIPCHPVDAQEAVAHALEEKITSTREVIRKTNVSIEKLKEYRASLITAAVTGQIDVTTWSQGATGNEEFAQNQEKEIA